MSKFLDKLFTEVHWCWDDNNCHQIQDVQDMIASLGDNANTRDELLTTGFKPIRLKRVKK